MCNEERLGEKSEVVLGLLSSGASWPLSKASVSLRHGREGRLSQVPQACLLLQLCSQARSFCRVTSCRYTVQRSLGEHLEDLEATTPCKVPLMSQSTFCGKPTSASIGHLKKTRRKMILSKLIFLFIL